MSTILIADDELSIRTILQKSLEKKGYKVICAQNGSEALSLLMQAPIDVGIVDIRMPGISGLELLKRQKNYPSKPSLFVMTAQDTMENAVESMKCGAVDYIVKPFDLDEIAILVKRALENRRLKTELNFLKEENEESLPSAFHLIGKSKPIREIYKLIGRVANHDETILITGESGTGKEMVAKAIHYQGNRSPYPFVAVNCSAIPRDLLESELFGHKKGAFTGAHQDKKGLFEQANLGTLFLDEIGEMPLNLQAKLLRVLQEREIKPVGGTKTIPVNVRIVAATNRELNHLVKKGLFREDLFFRINVVPCFLPPLRERKSDIPLLVAHFSAKMAKGEDAKKISPKALEFLSHYEWPGNVRELENVIRRACVLKMGSVLEKEDFEIILSANDKSIQSLALSSSLEDMVTHKLIDYFSDKKSEDLTDLYEHFLPYLERPLISLTLKSTQGNQIQAAKLLGINRNTLRKKINELGLGKKQ